MREALADRQNLFSAADRAFAEGLAADKIGDALYVFRRAVDTDPLHYLATTSYVMTLATVGEGREARRQAQFLRGVFPYSPVSDLAETIVDLFEGRRNELNRHAAAMSEKLPLAQRPAAGRLEEMFMGLLDLQDITFKYSGKESMSWTDAGRVFQLLSRMKKLALSSNSGPMILPVPGVGICQKRCLALFSAYYGVAGYNLGFAKPEAILQRLKTINDDYEDAAFLCLEGLVRSQMSVDPLNRGDVMRVREQFTEAADLCERLLSRPLNADSFISTLERTRIRNDGASDYSQNGPSAGARPFRSVDRELATAVRRTQQGLAKAAPRTSRTGPSHDCRPDVAGPVRRMESGRSKRKGGVSQTYDRTRQLRPDVARSLGTR